MKRRVVRARQSSAFMIAVMLICASSPALMTGAGNTDSNKIAGLCRKANSALSLPPVSARKDVARSKIIESLGRMRVSFEENPGQAGSGVKFISHAGGYSLFLSATEATFAFKKATSSDLGLMNEAKTGSMRETINSQSQVCDIKDSTLRIKFVGANAKAEMKGAGELQGKSNRPPISLTCSSRS